MKLKIKQVFLSFIDTYNIFDENNQIIYKMKDLKTLGCVVYDRNNIEIARIEKVNNLVINDFYFIKEGEKIGELLEETTLTIPTYKSPTKNWKVIFNFFGETKYKIIDENNQVIMTAKRNLLHITYNCDLILKDSEDIFYCIMIALALCSKKIKRRRHQ